MLFKKHASVSTNNHIINEGQLKGKPYFQRFYKSSTKPWFHNLKIKRELITTINRCWADHYNLNASLIKIKVVNSTSCECGHEYQDLNHILWQCPLYDNERNELNVKLAKQKLIFPLDVGIFLYKPDITIMSILLEYLKKCNLSI